MLIVVYSFKKLVIEPPEAYDVVSGPSTLFNISLSSVDGAALCGTNRQAGLNAKLSRGKRMGNPLFEKLYPEGSFGHLLELHVFHVLS